MLDMDVAVLGKQGGGFLQRRQRLLVPAKGKQRGTAPEKISGLLAVTGNQLVVISQRLRIVLLQHVDRRAVMQGFGVARLDGQGPRVTFYRFGETSELLE